MLPKQGTPGTHPQEEDLPAVLQARASSPWAPLVMLAMLCLTAIAIAYIVSN